ncbi:MAG: hypothetical protein GWN20_17855 [Phycisphaerae bacterium]|nr:hypothetical protein [Phycisphaerae bacterium]
MIDSVANHFDKSESMVKDIYVQLLSMVREFGNVKEEPKQTCIHWVYAKAFLGVFIRKNYLNVRFRVDAKLVSPKFTKTEQISKNRFLHTIKLESVEDIDEDLKGWLKRAHALAG